MRPMAPVTYSVFDLNVQVESTTGATGITGKSKTKHPRVPRVPRGLLFLNTQLKNALISLSVALSDEETCDTKQLAPGVQSRIGNCKPP